MNVKKILVTGATAALMLASASGVFAYSHNSGNSINIDNNSHLTNNVNTVANTGFNEVEGGHHSWGRGGSLTTGDATAGALVVNDVNSSSVSLCGCSSRHGSSTRVDIDNNSRLTNNVNTFANSGVNEVDNSGKLHTGDATALSDVESSVNWTSVQ